MAHILQLTDGTTTVTLTSGDYTLTEYTPSAVPASEALTSTIQETIAIVVSGASTTAVQSSVNDIDRLLTYASNRTRFGTGPKVYVKYQVSGESGTYRSEVVAGNVDLTVNTLKAWVGKTVEVDVNITRVGYWESDTLSTLVNDTTVTNGGGSNTVFTNSSGVTGTLPTPARVELRQAGASNIYWDRFWMSMNAWNDPTNFTGYINGAGTAITWTSNANDTSMEDFALSTAMLGDTMGDYFRVILALSTGTGFTNVQSDLYFRAQLMWGVTVLAEGGLVHSGTSGIGRMVYDLGALPLPPGGYYSNNQALTLRIAVTSTAASSGNYYIDYVQLLPAGPGRFRQLEQIGYDVDINDTIVDDPYDDVLYLEDNSGGDARLSLLTSRGAPLMLWPGKAHRFSVLYDESDASTLYVPTRSTGVTIKYRKRRATI